MKTTRIRESAPAGFQISLNRRPSAKSADGFPCIVPDSHILPGRPVPPPTLAPNWLRSRGSDSAGAPPQVPGRPSENWLRSRGIRLAGDRPRLPDAPQHLGLFARNRPGPRGRTIAAILSKRRPARLASFAPGFARPSSHERRKAENDWRFKRSDGAGIGFVRAGLPLDTTSHEPPRRAESGLASFARLFASDLPLADDPVPSAPGGNWV